MKNNNNIKGLLVTLATGIVLTQIILFSSSLFLFNYDFQQQNNVLSKQQYAINSIDKALYQQIRLLQAASNLNAKLNKINASAKVAAKKAGIAATAASVAANNASVAATKLQNTKEKILIKLVPMITPIPTRKRV